MTSSVFKCMGVGRCKKKQICHLSGNSGLFFSVSSGEAKRGRKNFRSRCVNIAVQLWSTTEMRREARHMYYDLRFASLLSERYFSNF